MDNLRGTSVKNQRSCLAAGSFVLRLAIRPPSTGVDRFGTNQRRERRIAEGAEFRPLVKSYPESSPPRESNYRLNK